MDRIPMQRTAGCQPGPPTCSGSVLSRSAACALRQSFEVAGEDFVTEVERDAGSDCNRMSDVCGRVSRFTSRRTL